jgi:hypothetical protein
LTFRRQALAVDRGGNTFFLARKNSQISDLVAVCAKALDPPSTKQAIKAVEQKPDIIRLSEWFMILLFMPTRSRR